MDTSAYLRHKLLRHVVGRPRLFVCVVLGILVFAVEPASWHLPTKVLFAWDTATIAYFIWTVPTMLRATQHAIRRQAIITDESRYVVLVLALVAAIASLAAIILVLNAAKDSAGVEKVSQLALAFGTIVPVGHSFICFLRSTMPTSSSSNVTASLIPRRRQAAD